jgi:hypothetical protein
VVCCPSQEDFVKPEVRAVAPKERAGLGTIYYERDSETDPDSDEDPDDDLDL